MERYEAHLGYEPSGPPLTDGLFARSRRALREYRFADPRITRGYYDPRAPLLGRDILVEVQVLLVHLLVGLRVREVLDRADEARAQFGIRLDTLDGHILRGSEWLLVTKDHRDGAVRLRIEVQWRPGRLPTWWLNLGVRLFGRQMQRRWRRQVVRRLRALGEREHRREHTSR